MLTPTPLPAGRRPLHGTPDQIVDGLRRFAAAGLDHLVAGVRTAGDATYAGCAAALDVVAAEVLPQL